MKENAHSNVVAFTGLHALNLSSCLMLCSTTSQTASRHLSLLFKSSLDLSACLRLFAVCEGVQHVSLASLLLQNMDVNKFWDLMIGALKAANAVSPLNK